VWDVYERAYGMRYGQHARDKGGDSKKARGKHTCSLAQTELRGRPGRMGGMREMKRVGEQARKKYKGSVVGSNRAT